MKLKGDIQSFLFHFLLSLYTSNNSLSSQARLSLFSKTLGHISDLKPWITDLPWVPRCAHRLCRGEAHSANSCYMSGFKGTRHPPCEFAKQRQATVSGPRGVTGYAKKFS